MTARTLLLIALTLVTITAGASRAENAPDDAYVIAAMNHYRLSRTVQLAAADPVSPVGQQEVVTDVPQPSLTWLAMGEPIAWSNGTAEAVVDASGSSQYVHWKERRGPAYPNDFWRSFGRDAKEMPATLWDDTKSTFTNKWALGGFAAAIAAGVAIDVANWNGCTADHYSKNGSQLNGFWDMVGDVGGNPGLHFGVAGAMYFSALHRGDTRDYEVSKAMLNALSLTGLVTLATKGVANNESPNGDSFGWASGHTSSSFAFATVMHEAYGPWVGVPMFAFATFVAYERVDARNHDLNDVVSGAFIGVAIGYAVMQNHLPKINGVEIVPYGNPSSGTVGMALSKSW